MGGGPIIAAQRDGESQNFFGVLGAIKVNQISSACNSQSGGLMSDEQQVVVEEAATTVSEPVESDGKADATAIVVIFTAAVLFCVFYISGWSFDL